MTRSQSHVMAGFSRAGRALMVLALAGAVWGVSATVARAETLFTISGAGYGHGIGLSQYGAKGYAERGSKGEDIATHYYPGTKIGTVADPVIKVNVDPDKTSANGGFTQASWRLRAGDLASALSINGVTAPFTGTGIYTFTGVTAPINGVNTPCIRVNGPDGTQLGIWAAVTVKPLGGSPLLIEVLDGSGIYDWTRVRYRGSMKFKVNAANKLGLLNVVDMQDYLKGVVPRESPSSWHSEALRAQAIVARSYAYIDRNNEMYCTTMDQAYAGHSRFSGTTTQMHEADSSNAAVDSTDGMYVQYGTTVVQTFFHSSSGGHTADKQTIWGGAAVPYFAGVEDPYCASPNYDPWKVFGGITYPRKVTGADLAAALGPKVGSYPSGTSVRSLRLNTAPSGFVGSFDVTWSNGAVSKDIDGDTMRQALGLPSTKFKATFGGPYTRISQPDRFSTAAAISKTAFPAVGPAVAVLVNGADAKFADSLTSSALGGVAGGPVLLTAANGLPESTRAELARLKPQKIYVVGGHASVPNRVANQALAAAGTTVAKRLGGADRYAVAAAVAVEINTLAPSEAKSVMIASGEKWPDSAIGAVASAMSKRPLLLVNGRGVPAATASAIQALGVTQTVVFGGEGTLPNPVISSVLRLTGETAPYQRFGMGGSRYDEAAAAASWCMTEFGASATTVYVASGETFPDSVVGGVLAAMGKNPMLLTSGKAPANAAISWLSARSSIITQLVVLGGPGSVSNSTAGLLGGAAY